MGLGRGRRADIRADILHVGHVPETRLGLGARDRDRDRDRDRVRVKVRVRVRVRVRMKVGLVHAAHGIASVGTLYHSCYNI